MNRNRTEIPHQAVALSYDGRRAPIVTAKGDGALADRIVEEALKHGVHISEDPLLLSLLARLELGEEIPPQLYSAVAVVLSWVYWLKGMSPQDRPR